MLRDDVQFIMAQFDPLESRWARTIDEFEEEMEQLGRGEEKALARAMGPEATELTQIRNVSLPECKAAERAARAELAEAEAEAARLRAEHKRAVAAAEKARVREVRLPEEEQAAKDKIVAEVRKIKGNPKLEYNGLSDVIEGFGDAWGSPEEAAAAAAAAQEQSRALAAEVDK